MIFVNKIVLNKTDESLHEKFVRFGKGIYENRALMRISVKKDSFHLYASYDLLGDLLEIATQKNETLNVKGVLIVKRKKQSIEGQMNGIELKEKISEADFALLDVNCKDISIACKKSLPKPGKNLDPKFCSVTMPKEYLKELIFEAAEFKDAEVSHTFSVTDIIVPKDYANDPAAARVNAKRKGKMLRKAVVDGKLFEKEVEFEV